MARRGALAGQGIPLEEPAAQQQGADLIRLVASGTGAVHLVLTRLAAFVFGSVARAEESADSDIERLMDEVLADPDAPGASALEDGQDVPAGTSRRLACDCSKVVMTHAPDGRILDVGRRTRTISPAL